MYISGLQRYSLNMKYVSRKMKNGLLFNKDHPAVLNNNPIILSFLCLLPKTVKGDAGEVDARPPVRFVAGVVGNDEFAVFDKQARITGVAS